MAATPGASWHERYIQFYRLIQDRDRDLDLDRTFDSLRRSTALYQLVAFRQHDLISPEDLDGFTQETRDQVTFLTGR